MPSHFDACNLWFTPEAIERIRAGRDDQSLSGYYAALAAAADRALSEDPPVFNGSKPANRRAIFAYFGRPLQLTLQFLLTGDQRYAAKARLFIERLGELHRAGVHNTGLCWFPRFSVEALQETVLCQSVFPAIQLLSAAGELDDKTTSSIGGKLIQTVANAMLSTGEHACVNPMNNHLLLDAMHPGKVAVFWPEMPYRNAMLDLSNDVLGECLETVFLDDGGWAEGAPGYHQCVVTGCFLHAEALCTAGLKDWYADERFVRTMTRAADWLLALTSPDGKRVFSSNDSSSGVHAHLIEAFASRLHLAVDPEPVRALARETGRGSDPEWCLLFAADGKATTRTPLRRTDVHLADTGVVVLRDEQHQSVCFAKINRQEQGHNHPDQCTFEYYAFGRLWAMDRGSPDYQAVEVVWTRSSFAHNTIARVRPHVETVHRQDYDYSNISLEHDDHHYDPGRVELRRSDADAAEAVLETTLYTGVTLCRRIILLKRVAALVIEDELTTTEDGPWDWCLQGPGTLEVEGTRFRFQIDESALAGELLAPDGVELLVRRAPEMVSVRNPATDQPTGEIRPARPDEQWQYLLARAAGRHVRFHAILAATGPEEPTWQRTADGVTVSRGRETQVI